MSMDPNAAVGPVLDLLAHQERQARLLAKAFVLLACVAPDMVAEESVSEQVKDSISRIPHLRQPGGHTLMWEYLNEGQLDCANAILSLGDQRMLLAKTDAGRSLLMAAVDGDQAEAVTWLLQQWAAHFGLARMHDLMEEQSLAGYSALWWCGMDGRESAAKRLLAYGADEQAVDRNKVSCAEIARQRRQNGVLALYTEAERGYFLSRMRHLVEVGRAVGPEREEGEHGEDEKAEGGGAEDKDRVIKAVAAFVVRELASDLAVELGLWMR